MGDRDGGSRWPEVVVGGLRTLAVTRAALAEVMVGDCRAARADPDRPPKLVFSANGQGIALAARDAAFAATMNAADIVHADGMPMVFASRMTRHPLPERVATTDFFHDAARAAVANDLGFYFLGGTEVQNAAAVGAVKARYPKLTIVGRHHGYFPVAENGRLCAAIRAAKPDVLWVALGKPKQEFWSVENRAGLGGVGWIKTCGGLYAFLAGDVPRAPVWMQRSGFEWLHRALREPKRLAWRYLTTNPAALYGLLTRTERAPRRK